MARPAEFDREQVLDRAMHAFWNQGYCATSMAKLTETTELKPGSLYAAFRSKEGLFLAALDHYGERSAEKIRQTLSSADTPLEGIRAFFAQLSEHAGEPQAERSCFLVNTVLEIAPRNQQVHDRVHHHLDRIEGLFRETLTKARESGELAPDKDPEALAAFFMTNIWGLRVLLAAGADPQRVETVVDRLLGLLD
ncbi:MAG: TetR/AcrR family transcriptional regulator [Pseudomonadota bacterium]|nr:TetR/AcrR family transcriptional regulator [Pseudomonadota bacterium]